MELSYLLMDLKINFKDPATKKENAKSKSKNDAKAKGISDQAYQEAMQIAPLEDLEWHWEKIISHSRQGISFKMFEQKFVAYFQKQFKILLPRGLLQKDCKCPK